MHAIPQPSKICEGIFFFTKNAAMISKTNYNPHPTPTPTFLGNFCLNVICFSKGKEKMVSRPRCAAESVMMDPLYEW